MALEAGRLLLGVLTELLVTPTFILRKHKLETVKQDSWRKLEESEIRTNLDLGREIVGPPLLAAVISLILVFSAGLLSGIQTVPLLTGAWVGDSALRFLGAGMTSSSFSSPSLEGGTGFRMIHTRSSSVKESSWNTNQDAMNWVEKVRNAKPGRNLPGGIRCWYRCHAHKYKCACLSTP